MSPLIPLFNRPLHGLWFQQPVGCCLAVAQSRNLPPQHSRRSHCLIVAGSIFSGSSQRRCAVE
jgi:hypothetical protein